MSWGAVISFTTLAVVVVACAVKFPPPTEAEMKLAREAELAAQLPDGCTVTDLGSFGEIDQMVAIRCEGKTVVNTIDVTRRTQLVGKVMQTVTDSNSVINIMPLEADHD